MIIIVSFYVVKMYLFELGECVVNGEEIVVIKYGKFCFWLVEV